MAKILMINLPFSGHVNPTLPLTKTLVSRGHHIDYICSEQFKEKIENTGANFIPYDSFPLNPTEKEKKKLSFQAAFDTALSMKDTYDLLIYEMFFYPGIQVAKQLGIPSVRQFSQAAWSDETWKNASKIFKISSFLIDAQVMGKKRIQSMHIPFESMDDAIRHSKPDMNIVYIPKSFQKYQDSFDDTFYFVVPKQEQVTGEFEKIPYHEMMKPIIYISLGSILKDKSFYKKCLKIFGGKNMSVILNIGKVKQESLGKIPNNICTYSYVPQVDVLQHVDVFLTHCGMNSVNEAIIAGVPMVAMPFINDQIENANQIEKLQIGKRIHSFPSRTKEIEDTVHELLNNPIYKTNIENMKNELNEKSNWNDIIEKIENLCIKKNIN
ncbi:glycosyltransferase family 1 protein [Piromyces sp. E2]|nr:glycosyltransferase family 1 protein [Piromyces sp. E2]|eukprot:OUM64533.1 glycosyltransferase family 1 protein [Piromyces sp. E2]